MVVSLDARPRLFNGVKVLPALDFLKKLYDYSARYILVAEYYNPTPVEVEYRGNTGKLFKRDFAGEIMDMYSDLKLVEYGFLYHRDIFPSDDATWFLMEKII